MRVQAILDYLDSAMQVEDASYTPLWIGGVRMGCVNAEWRARLLANEGALFQLRDGALHCMAASDYQTLSAQLGAAARRWRASEWLPGWRDENFTAHHPDGQPCFELERAAFRPLGLVSHAVHLNGLARRADGSVGMWVGRRSPFKAVDPNRMDNMVGGGVAAGESWDLALERESGEEAGIAPALVRGLAAQSLLLARRAVGRGLHCEWLHIYDLWLDAATVPANQDGEVAEHLLLSLEEVEALVLERRFMIDAALVACDCLARLGYWGEDGARVRERLQRTQVQAA
jgi:8-oxo-dGTP pyrophosphatase MutT (NUDIX family)